MLKVNPHNCIHVMNTIKILQQNTSWGCHIKQQQEILNCTILDNKLNIF